MPTVEMLFPNRERRTYSGGAPLGTMMKTTRLRNADDVSVFGPLHRTRHWRLFRHSEMATAVIVIVQERLQMARQAGPVEDDQM